jgi:hypothetical protein
MGRATAQAVSRRLPTAAARVQTRSGHVGFCDGQKWRWARFSPRTSVSPANLHSMCFSTIIFTITRGWHNRPEVAAVQIATQTKPNQTKKKKKTKKKPVLMVQTYISCEGNAVIYMVTSSLHLIHRKTTNISIQLYVLSLYLLFVNQLI